MDERLYTLDNIEQEKFTEFERLVYSLLASEDGQKMLEHLKSELMEQRWYPSEDPSVGYFREGANSMYRYWINIYERVLANG